ncbi:PPOX class probable F420-dependent enzyme [Mycobacterium sp. MAA66]|uniref:PPOX class F420-dependent oxidoreductase n=1 Tax=Mycobacterium sp. MAA66 TaxID=3156297 RepID=UPI003518AA59
MQLNDQARALIGAGVNATLVTLNADGSPQVSVVWVELQSTPDGDELVSAHLNEHKKVRNARRDPRVALTIIGADRGTESVVPYLAITGTARIVEGGAPAVLTRLTEVMAPEFNGKFPPPDAPPGFLTRITIDKVTGIGPWT